MSQEVAVLAGGCFWCTEAIYLDVAGVEKVESGY
ncbi:MAG TPA: peptide-methionine (S)-S-oxide reductase, partial [Sphingomicrobium sp.]|nr:peptide-methionine (S)-S-oxide reductase [Sphingomicrobium sp.]